MRILRPLVRLILYSGALLSGAAASAQPTYFPPRAFAQPWATVAPAQLGWNQVALDSVVAYVGRTHGKSLIILHGGRIAAEQYYGTHTRDSIHGWNSAAKTLAAFMVGVAQQEGHLTLNDPTAQHLGVGWTSLTPAQEQAITVRHQLTMTSGLDDNLPPTPAVPDPDTCLAPACLQYLVAPGTRWAYHDAPYHLVQEVVAAATGTPMQQYTLSRLFPTTGINGRWVKHIFYSRARDMARFGLLLLNRGTWDTTRVLRDTAYFGQMTRPSQSLNRAYGYLTWLNGQSSYMLPQLPVVIPGPLSPAAPADLYAALGKDDQKIYVVPSLNLVVVRQGDAADRGLPLGPSSFDNELWARLMRVFGPTGVAAAAPTAAFSLYPNPARHTAHLSGAPGPTAVLTDGLGRTVRTVPVTAGAAELDLRGLAPGLYVVRAGGAARRLVVE